MTGLVVAHKALSQFLCITEKNAYIYALPQISEIPHWRVSVGQANPSAAQIPP
jgi:hypothetical protein